MNYRQIRRIDISNGPGIRVSLFVSGCTLRCKGCFNSELWDFASGQPFTDKEIELICNELSKSHIRGLSILGGEPLDNAKGLIPLVEVVKSKFGDSKDIWLYTGYVIDSFDSDSIQAKLISMCDVVVDGPFIEELKDSSLIFRGSSNQRIINVKEYYDSNRCNASD